MKYWTIKVYSNNGKVSAFNKWLKTIPKGAQMEINVRLRFLQTQQHWERPLAAKLKGVKDIYEIRIKWQKTQYRPLGFFGPNSGDFTLLIGSKEKDRKFVPVDADEIADQRRNFILQGKGYAINYF